MEKASMLFDRWPKAYLQPPALSLLNGPEEKRKGSTKIITTMIKSSFRSISLSNWVEIESETCACEGHASKSNQLLRLFIFPVAFISSISHAFLPNNALNIFTCFMLCCAGCWVDWLTSSMGNDDKINYVYNIEYWMSYWHDILIISCWDLPSLNVHTHTHTYTPKALQAEEPTEKKCNIYRRVEKKKRREIEWTCLTANAMIIN